MGRCLLFCYILCLQITQTTALSKEDDYNYQNQIAIVYFIHTVLRIADNILIRQTCAVDKIESGQSVFALVPRATPDK